MNIKCLGHSSFLLKSKNAKIVTDPFDSSVVGLPFVGQEADIVTISHHHKDHDNLSKITGEPTVIDWPGEFEIKGVRIFGYRSYHDKQKGAERGEVVIYKYEIEDVSVAHCGDLGVIPDASLIDSIGNIDVLLVPVGGIYTIDAAEAVKLVKKLDPFVVIPMHYRTDKINQEKFGQLATVQDFITEFDGEVEEVEGMYKIGKDELNAESTKCVVFK